MTGNFVLPGDAFPVTSGQGHLDDQFWAGTRQEEIRIQHCLRCDRFQWGPEVICHHCHSFDLDFRRVEPRGTIYSWQRSWRPVRPELAGAMPYVVLIVELSGVAGIRMLGNLVGDQLRPVPIGAAVEAAFEHHADYTLVQWVLV